MTTINGKLVELNLRSADEFADNLKTVYQPEQSQEKEIENLQLSVYTLDCRINEVETNTNSLRNLYQKLEGMEKQTSQKILAITIVGAIGFTILGVWIGLSNKSSITARNIANYTETSEVQNR